MVLHLVVSSNISNVIMTCTILASYFPFGCGPHHVIADPDFLLTGIRIRLFILTRIWFRLKWNTSQQIIQSPWCASTSGFRLWRGTASGFSLLCGSGSGSPKWCGSGIRNTACAAYYLTAAASCSSCSGRPAVEDRNYSSSLFLTFNKNNKPEPSWPPPAWQLLSPAPVVSAVSSSLFLTVNKRTNLSHPGLLLRMRSLLSSSCCLLLQLFPQPSCWGQALLKLNIPDWRTIYFISANIFAFFVYYYA